MSGCEVAVFCFWWVGGGPGLPGFLVLVVFTVPTLFGFSRVSASFWWFLEVFQWLLVGGFEIGSKLKVPVLG